MYLLTFLCYSLLICTMYLLACLCYLARVESTRL